MVHITKRRIEDMIASNTRLKSFSSEIIHNYNELNLLYTSSTRKYKSSLHWMLQLAPEISGFQNRIMVGQLMPRCASAMLAGTNNIEEVSSTIIENALDVIKADYGSVLLADEDKEELYVAYTHGKGDSYNQRIKFGQGVCGMVALERKPMLIESKDNLPQRCCCGPLFHPPPLIACPMIVKKKLIGVIILIRESGDNVFNAMNLKLLEVIASQAAVAFMNVKFNDDLMESNQQLEDVLKRLKTVHEQLIQSQRLAAMRQLVANMAHNINNPLNGIMGYSELLLMSNQIDGEVRKKLEIIHEEAQRVADVVRNLKTFAKKRTHKHQPVNLNHIIQGILRITEKTIFAAQNIQVIADLEKNLPSTMADSGQIQQVLVNLLINAKEAMGGSGRIEIKTEILNEKLPHKPKIRFSVSDNGHGIPKEIQGKIFEPFFTTRNNFKSAGLGLSMCHGIVLAHEGSIYFESEVGKGTTFFVELPIVRPQIKLNFNPLIKRVTSYELRVKTSRGTEHRH